MNKDILSPDIHSFKSKPLESILFPLIVLAASIIPWSGLVSVPFLNDDFQILVWNNPQNLLDCFRPFYSADISVSYWRPIVNTIHSLSLWLFGYEAMPFRIINMLIYSSCCLAFLVFLKKLGIRPVVALIAAVFFSVLPSHEISVGWIAGRGDTLAALFILLASIFYIDGARSNKKWDGILPALFFLMAILSKEIAFMWIFFPLLYQITQDKDNRSFRQASIASLALFADILVVLLYRSFIIEATLLDSQNLQSVSITGIIYNLATYLPLSFLSPEILEGLYVAFLNNIVITVLIIVLSGLAVFFSFKEFRQMDSKRKRLFLFGLAWFVLFIIPVSTLLMRWYVFTASIGLIIAISSLMSIDIAKRLANGVMFFVMLAVIRFVVVDFKLIDKWQTAGHKMEMIMNGLENLEIKGYKKVSLWAVPDKINRVNTMKIGVQEAVNFALGRKDLEVLSHLRVECSDETEIRCRKTEWRTFELAGDHARFLPIGGKSRAFPKADTLNIKRDDIEMQLINPGDKTIKPIARITMSRKFDILYLYYNGKKFVPFCD